MGRALYSLPLLAPDLPDRHLLLPAVRPHDLDPVPKGKFILLFDPAPALFVHLFHGPQIGVVLLIGALAVDLALRQPVL